MTPKYHVIIYYQGKAYDTALLVHRGRDQWSKRIAKKHAKEFTAKWGNRTEISEV